MARRHSHVKPRKKNYFLRFLTIIIVLALLAVAASNISIFAEHLKNIPVMGEVVDILDFSKNDSEPNYIPVDEDTPLSDAPLTQSVRIFFDSQSTDSGSPAYMIRDGVSPRRLEFILYNVYDFDIEALTESLSGLDFIKDVYRTTVLDDSMRTFTVELSKDISYTASEYNSEGYIDLTLTQTGNDSDDTIYIVRSASGKMNEDMASLCESVSDFSPSIVKTQSGKYCIVAGACSTEEEADDLLSYLDDDFYIEECTIFSNPE